MTRFRRGLFPNNGHFSITSEYRHNTYQTSSNSISSSLLIFTKYFDVGHLSWDRFLEPSRNRNRFNFHFFSSTIMRCIQTSWNSISNSSMTLVDRFYVCDLSWNRFWGNLEPGIRSIFKSSPALSCDVTKFLKFYKKIIYDTRSPFRRMWS